MIQEAPSMTRPSVRGLQHSQAIFLILLADQLTGKAGKESEFLRQH